MIPPEQREDILQQLHIGHFGIEKTKQRARDAVYWPRLNTDIESLIARCSICQEHQWAPQKEPMVNRPIPTRPFQMVAVDLFECDGKHYLSRQDYYSRYIEVERLYSTRASFIIMKMKWIMAIHGIPEQVFSDNGPQFSCAEFAQFANTWGFVHSTSSPRYPQSNGLAEKAVQTAKRIAMKATASGRDPYIALLEYRTTPISDCGKSPAQLLMSRRLISILPSTPASLQPVLVNPEDIQLRFEEKQDKQKRVYDRNARTRASISVGDQILMRKNSGGYQSAVVTEKTDAPRSYNVRTKDGAIYRRTSQHLKKPRHYAGEVPRTSAPEALRYEIPREPQLPVLPPNQPVEIPVADVPDVPEVNNLPSRSRYGRLYKPPIRYEA